MVKNMIMQNKALISAFTANMHANNQLVRIGP